LSRPFTRPTRLLPSLLSANLTVPLSIHRFLRFPPMPGWAPPEMARRELLLDQKRWIPSILHQLGLSVTTLRVFPRKHFIADVCSDIQTKGLIRPGWNDLV
jgi:hypothetical protein